MNIQQQEIKRMTAVMAKRLECALFYGKNENFKRVVRKTIKKNLFGAIYRHDLVEIRLDQINDVTLKTKVTKHGVYKWLNC